jgi:hypothetical protein
MTEPRKARRCQREGQRRLEHQRREKKLTSFGELAAALDQHPPRQDWPPGGISKHKSKSRGQRPAAKLLLPGIGLEGGDLECHDDQQLR